MNAKLRRTAGLATSAPAMPTRIIADVPKRCHGDFYAKQPNQADNKDDQKSLMADT